MNRTKQSDEHRPLGTAVSVIIPLYNKENSIRDTLTQLLNVAPPPNEIIVVDDGSTDHSYEVANEFSQKISLYRQQNSGPSSARNLGARYAKNAHLIFLDADDNLLKGACEEHLKLRKLFPGSKLSCVSFKIHDVLTDKSDEQLLITRLGSKNNHDVKELKQFNFKLIENIAAGSFCVDRDLFFSSGGFDERLRVWEITESLIRFRLYTESQAISNKILCRINKDPRNSQFSRFQRDSDQHIYYAEKLIKYATLLPKTERQRVDLEITYCLNKLWINRNLSKMSDLFFHAKQHLDPNSLKNLSIKIKATSFLILYLKKLSGNNHD